MAQLLVVDDEESVRRFMTRWLKGPGHVILEADSAEAALEVMARQRADVVFADLQMPGRGGLWMTAELRRLYPTTAVVLATGVSTVAPRISMQSGVLAYLVKPFTQRALLDALAMALDWCETARSTPAKKVTEEELRAWLDSVS